MKQLTESQIGKLKQRLLEEKRELENHFEINGSAVERQEAVSSGELSTYDNHPADIATEAFERERDQAIDETFSDKLQDINAALQRMEQGTYGICEVCENQIPYERLEALPWTAFCVDHANTNMNLVGDSETQDPVTYEMVAPILPDDADAARTLEQYGSASSPVPGPREG
ncbi:TraR/DksA C4-type zinc finger protein [Cohnella pontilimi]|nr:TraR/DksA C4-type zinc finger protein [Cohnella pontilimi]